MLKKSILLGAVALIASGASGAYLSPQEACRRAVDAPSGRRLASAVLSQVPESTVSDACGNPAVYIFSRPEGGALFVSASSLALPVLGYTDGGEFDAASMPPQLKAWLNDYAAQISSAESASPALETKEITLDYPSDWGFIAPMLTTKWNQGAPFNGDIENRYATGCVATAMAQIMKYWQYPEIGHGNHSYSYQGYYGTVTNSIDFSAAPFDWDSMLDTYAEGAYTSAQADAVAYLMKACGFAVNTVYGASSGSHVELVPGAMADFFGYDGSIRSVKRYRYTNSEWAAILYDQLKNVGPVLYSGSSQDPIAHAFVADGYDGNGYFHINWGWSGLSNGFFALDALTPPVQSTGGGTGGYIFSQGMIVDIMKPAGNPPYELLPELTLLGNLQGVAASDGTLLLTMTQANPGNVVNTSGISVSPQFGINIRNAEHNVSAPATQVLVGGHPYTGEILPPGSALWRAIEVSGEFDSSLPYGDYEVSLVWRPSDGVSETWNEFVTANGCTATVLVSKSAEGFTVVNPQPNRFIIEKAEITSPLYMRNPCEIQFTLYNPTEYELTQSIFPVLYFNGELIFTAKGQVVTVGPGERVSPLLFYTFSQVKSSNLPTLSTPKEYRLGAFDYSVLLDENYAAADYGDSYYGDLGTVTMSRPGPSPSMKAVEISVANASEAMEEEGLPVYGVDDFSNILLKATVTVEGSGTFMSSPLTAVVSEYDPVTGTLSDPVYEKTFERLVYAASGEEGSASTVLDMEGFDVSGLYRVEVLYMDQSERKSLGSILMGASSGVGSVEADGATVSVFDLSGNPVSSSLSGLGRGVYIVVTAGADGQRSVSKILK